MASEAQTPAPAPSSSNKPATNQPPKRKRLHLHDFPSTLWTTSRTPTSGTGLNLPEQPPLSGSDSDSAKTDENEQQQQQEQQLQSNFPLPTPTKHPDRLQFQNPDPEKGFLVLYSVILPDKLSLASLANRGNCAIIMAGGGHFCAAIWDVTGKMIAHKTFHRYTTRKKQGGSQAAADEARGNAGRIRSAGATLRRYGEQALEKEVRELLTSWKDIIDTTQLIFIRASIREKRDLLFGWNGSPLKKHLDEDRVRNIPIATRRATLKEATRVYEQLTTVIVSPTSLLEADENKTESQQSVEPNEPTKSISPSEEQPVKEKGTDHLKKREEKSKPIKSSEDQVDTPAPPLNEEFVKVLSHVLGNDKEAIQLALRKTPGLAAETFGKEYFQDDDRFTTKREEPLGLLAVAAITGAVDLVEFLLDEGVDPCTGLSPYIATKNKTIRTFLRKYWGSNPDKYDYAKAHIPGPLSTGDLEAQAEKERAKRRRDKAKKKEKAQEKEQAKLDAAKTPQQRARELRAAAAEARLLGNKCAMCKKSLEGQVPFERLSYKYCATECVQNHRKVLNST